MKVHDENKQRRFTCNTTRVPNHTRRYGSRNNPGNDVGLAGRTGSPTTCSNERMSASGCKYHGSDFTICPAAAASLASFAFLASFACLASSKSMYDGYDATMMRSAMYGRTEKMKMFSCWSWLCTSNIMKMESTAETPDPIRDQERVRPYR